MDTAKKAPAGNRSRMARANSIPGCALTAALAAIGGRWKLFVVYRLADGPHHFASLRRSLPDVSAKVLAQQLRELHADGLVSRERSGPVPAFVHYALTSHGQSVLPLAEAIRRWGISHQLAHAGTVRPEDVADVRASCRAALPSATKPAMQVAVGAIE
jgi:DNA-binding HxlR family transcriptional regulator